jgi:hypothetical protein
VKPSVQTPVLPEGEKIQKKTKLLGSDKRSECGQVLEARELDKLSNDSPGGTVTRK